jgi:hypothetical protein
MYKVALNTITIIIVELLMINIYLLLSGDLK